MMLLSDHIGRIGWVKWLAIGCKEPVKMDQKRRYMLKIEGHLESTV